MKSSIITSSLLALLLAVSSSIWAQDAAAPVKEKSQAQKREQIYGSQLMTQQERNAHRAKIRDAKTEQEREQIRLEHHKQMQERAKERGVSLPDEPPMRGQGAGKCGGSGMPGGPGAGMPGPGAGKCGGAGGGKR